MKLTCLIAAGLTGWKEQLPPPKNIYNKKEETKELIHSSAHNQDPQQ